MSPEALPDEARELIRRHIDSLARLDVLLVLYRDPGDRWSAARMGRQMRASAKWARGQMQALERAGFADCAADEWAYAPADERTDRATKALVDACRADWPAVTREVMGARASGAQAFSDAFRFRRRDG